MAKTYYRSLVAGGWRDLPFEHFRDGIEVHWILKGGDDSPSVALLKYAPGSAVPRHEHAGTETILVLDGAQADENGEYSAGTFTFNAEGTQHSVWSERGCVVLIHWDRPVIIQGE